MQDWKDGRVPVNAGREPRQSTNHTGALLKQAERKVAASSGGNPKTVTHQGPSRRGSRVRSKDRAALAACQDLQEYHGELSSPESLDPSSLQAQENKVESPQAASPPPTSSSPNISWSSESCFTKEAIAESDRMYAANKERPTKEAILAASRDLQETYKRTHGKGGPKNRRQAGSEVQGMSASPAPRGRLPNSHLLLSTPKKPR